MTRSVRIAFSIAVLLAPLTVAPQDTTTAAPAFRSIMTGVFSVDQADRGRVAHRTSCTSCHGSTKYVGEDFAALYLGNTAFEILDKLRTTMPDDNPGVLPVQEYVDIIAYIFNINGYPAGAEELPIDEAALRSVKVDVPPPPRSGLARSTESFPHAPLPPRPRAGMRSGHGR